MIIIREQTEKKLVERLEALRKNHEIARCLAFHFTGELEYFESIISHIIRYVEKHLEINYQHQLYICEDKNVYLLGQMMAPKILQNLAEEVAQEFNIDAEDLTTLYELPGHIYPLLSKLDDTLQKENNEKREAKHQALTAEEQKKHRSILSVVNEEGAKETIIRKRMHRKHKEVLIIEDDSFTRQLVVNLLQKRCFIKGIGNPANALSTYVAMAPDITFLDINLPGVSGHELLRRIMQLDPKAYVVMLSGNADKQNITEAIQQGAKGFIGKPFTKDKLLQYLEKSVVYHA